MLTESSPYKHLLAILLSFPILLKVTIDFYMIWSYVFVCISELKSFKQCEILRSHIAKYVF